MQINFWKKHSASQINDVLDALPTAELRALYAETPDETVAYSTDKEKVNASNLVPLTDKGVFVADAHIANVSKDYKLVQHRQAFAPIVEALAVKGVENYEFTAWANNRKAFLGVLVAEANDTLQYGFRCSNALDGSGSISYGLKAKRVDQFAEIVEKEHVTVWGIRKTCSNGSIIKIPLKSTKYLDVETREKVTQLMTEFKNIRHTKGAEERVLEVQYLVEAFLLLRNPLNRMIFDAQKLHLEPAKVKELITKYVGERVVKRIEQDFYRHDDRSLYGLWNAVTSVASHTDDYKDGTRNSLLDKAANLLTGELLLAEAPVAE